MVLHFVWLRGCAMAYHAAVNLADMQLPFDRVAHETPGHCMWYIWSRPSQHYVPTSCASIADPVARQQEVNQGSWTSQSHLFALSQVALINVYQAVTLQAAVMRVTANDARVTAEPDAAVARHTLDRVNSHCLCTLVLT